MCEGCLTQNFEVAVREKHVRNWVCPLCDAPQLQDEKIASEYFEFLSLQVRRNVEWLFVKSLKTVVLTPELL